MKIVISMGQWAFDEGNKNLVGGLLQEDFF